MKVTFICYPKCTTCKKARTWLESHLIPFEERDIKLQNPTVDELREWYHKSGMPLKRFFNTSGQLYRSMELSKKLPEMGEEEQLELLASDGMMVKRPILLAGDQVLTGFREADWEKALL